MAVYSNTVIHLCLLSCVFSFTHAQKDLAQRIQWIRNALLWSSSTVPQSLIICSGGFVFCIHSLGLDIGPLLDDGLMRGTPKAMKGLPSVVCSHFGVSVYVCLWSSYMSQFLTQNPNFLKIWSLGLWEENEMFIMTLLGPFPLFS